jgi:PAS domain S-box-containing protein
MFIRIISNKEDYDQIRFIDNKGLEVVRVNRKDDIFATEEGELQNKFDRYYFQETIALNYDDVYISPLDLNMENGEIEMPPNPMIRIGTPVFNTENQLLGIVIINYKADYFLNILKNHEEHEEFYASKFYILNKEGQFIIHPNSDYNFSFMYDDKEKISFEDEYIDLWQNMESNDFIGSYLDNHTVVTYYDLLNISLDKSGNENKWIMVHMMDASNLLSFDALVNNLILSRNGVISFIILVIVYAIAIVIERLKNRELELDITKEIATSTNDAIIITDSKTRITYVNEMYEQYTGYSSNEVLGLKPSMFKSGKHNSEFYREMWSSINTKGHWEGTLWDKKKNGMLYPKKLKIIAVNDNRRNANPHHYVGIFSDISAIKESCDQYEILNYKNGKRLIPNEKIMMDLLQESIKNEKFHFMVLYLSIENYSQLANTFEEQNIDLAKTFMELAQPFIKNDDLIAQTGKNLFALIIGIHNIESSTHEYVTNLHRNLSKVISINGKDVFFKSKLGVSHWPQDTEDIKKLLMNSMIALEWTSKRGDSEISYYKDFMIDELNQESEIESQLKNAIVKKEFSIVYQPQVDIQSNKVIGMEALLRWHNEGANGDGSFLPLFFVFHLNNK